MIKMIDNICSASLQAVNHIINHLKRGKTGDHSNVDLFQASVCQLLNGCNNRYSWACEQKGPSKTGDRIDILGTPNSKGDNKWVIEIDATRHDQLATKFVSRMAIMSLNKPINYVALLYPGPDSIRANSKSMCEKYVFFANLIANKLGSRVYGIYIDVNVGKNKNEDKKEEDAIKNPQIELWDFNKNNFEITKDGTTLESAKSMNKCAQKVISHYFSQNPTINFKVLDKVFTGEDGFHFIKDDKTQTADKKSYTGSVETTKNGIVVKTTKDGIVVKSYTQFRNDNGSQAHWLDFESICTSRGYTIKRKWTIYKFDTSLTLIDKKDPTDKRVYQLYEATSSTKIDKVDPTGTIKLNKLKVPSSSICSCRLNGGKSVNRCASAKRGIIQ